MVQAFTHAELLALLEYDPGTGKFRWINKSHGLAKVGWFEGSKHSSGYRTFMIWGKLYLSHRLAWFYMTGEWPTNQIDHKDRNRSNNAFENLREATEGENKRNSSLRSDNTSGVKGVAWLKSCQRWRAQIQFEHRSIYIGIFKVKEDAIVAYTNKAKELFGEFYHVARSL